MKNASENSSQGFKNGSGIRPEMMSNRSKLPKMMNNSSQSGDANVTMNGSKTLRHGPSGMEKNINVIENTEGATDKPDFFCKAYWCSKITIQLTEEILSFLR
jgi:hypothetical protein